MKFQNPKKKLKQLEYDYTLDQRELGKILVISSLTLIIISSHLLLNLQQAMNQAKTAEERLGKLDAVVSTQRFNSSMEALKNLEGTTIGDRMEYALDTFRGMQTTVNGQEKVYSQLEKTQKTYQWLFLTGIIGLVSGAAAIYV